MSRPLSSYNRIRILFMDELHELADREGISIAAAPSGFWNPYIDQEVPAKVALEEYIASQGNTNKYLIFFRNVIDDLDTVGTYEMNLHTKSAHVRANNKLDAKLKFQAVTQDPNIRIVHIMRCSASVLD